MGQMHTGVNTALKTGSTINQQNIKPVTNENTNNNEIKQQSIPILKDHFLKKISKNSNIFQFKKHSQSIPTQHGAQIPTQQKN